MNDSPINPDRAKSASRRAARKSSAEIETRFAENENRNDAVLPPDAITLAPDKLNDLISEAENTTRQKAAAELERREIENQALKIQNERLKDENARLVELHNTRKQYVGRLFGLISLWLGVVVLFVALAATLKNNFALSDAVLIAFITSTTVSVIALFVIVAKWLFPSAATGDDKKE